MSRTSKAVATTDVLMHLIGVSRAYQFLLRTLVNCWCGANKGVETVDGPLCAVLPRTAHPVQIASLFAAHSLSVELRPLNCNQHRALTSRHVADRWAPAKSVIHSVHQAVPMSAPNQATLANGNGNEVNINKMCTEQLIPSLLMQTSKGSRA